MYEPTVFKRIINLFALYLFALALTIKPAMADVPLPPPTTATAQIQTIANAGNGVKIEGTVRGSNGMTFNYSVPNRPSTNHYSSIKHPPIGQQAIQVLLNALKSNPTTFTDNYGNKAQGRISTASQLPANNKLATGLSALMVADFSNAHLNRMQQMGVGERFFRGIETGDWTETATAVAQLADWTGFGSNVSNAIRGTDMQPIAEHMQQQAQQMFQNYQSSKIDPSQYANYTVLTVSQNHPSNTDKSTFRVLIPGQFNGSYGWFNSSDHGQTFSRLGYTYTFPQGNRFVIFNANPATAQTVAEVNREVKMPQLADLTPRQDDLIPILLNILNDSNRNLTDLINALVASGGLNPSDLPTTVTGSERERTFYTDAYTPAGSETAQQTKFVVNPDGSVTVSTVQRPDLAANSSQAPTRQPIGNSPKRPRPDIDDDDDDVDICENNPNILACLEPGSADYEDIVLPTEERKFEFNTKDIFSSNGTCPAPRNVQIITSKVELTYQPLCDMAARLRSFVIFCGVVASMFLLWRTLENG